MYLLDPKRSLLCYFHDLFSMLVKHTKNKERNDFQEDSEENNCIVKVKDALQSLQQGKQSYKEKNNAIKL